MLHKLEPPPSVRARQRRAQWQRDYRARYDAGVIVAPTPISGEVVNMLIRLKWLEEAKARDRYEIGRALARMVEEAARG
jgi:hypothetical protein